MIATLLMWTSVVVFGWMGVMLAQLAFWSWVLRRFPVKWRFRRVLVLALLLVAAGCRSQRTDAERYPVPVMLDPVTEVTPNVVY